MFTLFLAAAGTACGAGAPEPLAQTPDAAQARDAMPSPDAAPTEDAAAAEDAAEADAARPMDAGADEDAGLAADAGPVAGPPDLRAWFADYNADQPLDYLELPIGGAGPDPRYAAAAPHTFHPELHYGPHTRNLLDVWSLDQAAPAPVVVYIHGGGFQAGSKESIHQNPQTIPQLLAAGFTVASISYRFAYRDPDAALLATNPDDEGSVHDENGTRLDFILRDCARAIQFLRHRAAELHLDPSRIGAYGGSAGAGCAAWVGTAPDLAVREHRDPVLRESSRLQAIGHTNGQPTYAWPRWPALLQMSPAFVFDNVESEAVRLTQTSLDALRRDPDGLRLSQVLDYYAAMGPGDPPFFTLNLNPDLDETEITDPSEVIHHPRAHVALYERCAAAGLDCSLRTRARSEGPDRDLLGFMTRVLAP